VAGRGEKRNAYGFFFFGGQNLNETDHLQDLGVYGRIILEFILKKSFGRAWTGLIWLRTGPSDVLS
jgi:hypothetical protein